jgi:hypothetical protein
MRRSNWTPSIVPRGDDHDVYLVVDDLGRVWREADYGTTDWETVITDLLAGEQEPDRRDCPEFSRGLGAIRKRCDLQQRDVPSSLRDFVDRHDAVDRSQLSLPLRMV